VYQPGELARRIREHREARALSALALAQRAGLSMNYVRNVERELRRPSEKGLEAISNALALAKGDRLELRRLAGIDTAPQSTHAKAVRHGAWRTLTYLLVNHVYLPRLEWPDQLRTTRSTPERELLESAAAASDLAAFVHAVADRKPPRSLLTRLENTFASIPPDRLEPLEGVIRSAIDTRFDPHAADEFHWPERNAVAYVLAAVRNAPLMPEPELLRSIAGMTFDYSFAICLFPPLFWHACHAWPFEKVKNPLARAALPWQRMFYDAVRGGLSLDDLCEALLGRLPLGPPPPSAPPPSARPSPLVWSGSMPGLAGTAHVDCFFDHWDRADLLARFPLVGLDRASFEAIARAQEHAYWRAWRDEHALYKRWLASWPDAPKLPPLPADRFASIFTESHYTGRTMDQPSAQTLQSKLGRLICDRFADAAAERVASGQWQALDKAAAALGLPLPQPPGPCNPFGDRADDDRFACRLLIRALAARPPEPAVPASRSELKEVARFPIHVTSFGIDESMRKAGFQPQHYTVVVYRERGAGSDAPLHAWTAEGYSVHPTGLQRPIRLDDQEFWIQGPDREHPQLAVRGVFPGFTESPNPQRE